jgi:hypothetical protein
MALNTLKGVTEIGGFPVIVMDELREKFPHKFNESGSMDYKWFEEEIRPNHFIYIRHDKNSISFTLQSAPVSDVKAQRMLQDFKYYLADVTERQNAEWDTDELHKHALRCIEEDSQDWKDFNAKYGNDYTGVNGCQVDTLIHAALIMLKGLNAKVGCVENDNAINKLEMALHWLGQRTIDRQQRGVEGTSKE